LGALGDEPRGGAEPGALGRWRRLQRTRPRPHTQEASAGPQGHSNEALSRVHVRVSTKPIPREKILDARKLRVVRAQLPLVERGCFYLAGGTGLALHLGHRLSIDLDWFTATAFDEDALLSSLKGLAEEPASATVNGPKTVRA